MWTLPGCLSDTSAVPLYIPQDLKLHKLSARSVRVSLLGYFGYDGYKLLDKSTGAVFRSRDVIFEEGIIYIAKQPNPIIYNKKNDPFQPSLELKTETKQESTPENPNPNLGPNSDLLQATAPRPLPIPRIHNEERESNETFTVQLISQTIDKEKETNLPLTICWTRRDPKPSTKLKESTEYLNCSVTYITNMDIQVPKTYNKAMKRPDLWLDPITKEIEMLKLWDVFEVVPRPSGKNVVGSKWVFAVK